jgi:enoyl-CoA hydratase/carnithine racemase
MATLQIRDGTVAMTDTPTISDPIITSVADRVMTLRINRPAKKNALTQEMYSALADAFSRAHCDPEIRVLYLTGVGDYFTSGNDLNDFAASPPDLASDDVPPVGRFLSALAATTKPLVIAVNGAAVGIGVTMLLHADLVYAARHARFKMPFIDLALVPEAGSSLILPQRVGHALASEWLLLGEGFDGEEALRAGIVARLFDVGTLDAQAYGRARALAQKAPEAVRQTKALLNDDRGPLRERIAKEGEIFSQALRSEEFAEAVTAFFEKRPADFSRF